MAPATQVNRSFVLHFWGRVLDSTMSRPPLLLTLFGLCLYLLTTGAYLDNPDGRSMYSVTRGLVLRSSITIPETERLDTLFEKVGREGAIYSKYGLTQPILQIPLFLVGRWFAPNNERAATETAVSLLQAGITAITLPLIWSIAKIFFKSERVALLLALIYGTTTMAWLYATLTYTEPLLTLLMLIICWLLLRAERNPASSLILTFSTTGVIAGISILTKYPAIIYFPALLWYTWKIGRDNHRAWLAFVIPLLIGVIALASYNLWRYEDIWNTGYHIKELIRFPRPPWYGIYVLFFSLGKSIFIYAPPLAISLYMFPRFLRQADLFGGFMLILLCSSVVFYAIVSPWCGAWSPGPRYHLPVLPLAILPLGVILMRWKWLALWKRLVCISVCAVGLIIQFIAVSISYNDVLLLLQTITADQYAWGFWFFDPDYVPIIWQGRLLISALTRSITGHSLFPELSHIASVDHPRAPMDQINSWFAHLSPTTGLGQIILGILLLLLIAITSRLLFSLVRYPHLNQQGWHYNEE
jgi:4-amino-4-deoxy-L-arabinose transferase-like glycosyltransferase